MDKLLSDIIDAVGVGINVFGNPSLVGILFIVIFGWLYLIHSRIKDLTLLLNLISDSMEQILSKGMTEEQEKKE